MLFFVAIAASIVALAAWSTARKQGSPSAPLALLVAVYLWANPELVAADALLREKAAYLNLRFFTVRAVVYFAIWGVLGYTLSSWSRQQDRELDAARAARLRGVSALGLVVLFLTMSFAAVDWGMSLAPHWFSTIYGVLFIVSAALSALSFTIVLLARLAVEPPFKAALQPVTVHDLGKLLLAFTMLWGYVNFSQFLIVWSGNLPEETPWYIQRLSGGWQYVALLLVVFHFALLFLLLLSRDLKRNARPLAMVAGGVLLMRLVDLFWLVAPDLQGHGEGAPHGLAAHWLDLAAPAFLGGVWLLLFVPKRSG